MKIVTNNVPRPELDAYDIIKLKATEEFDYYNWDEPETIDAAFVRYKGSYHDLNEFEVAPTEFVGWHGYHADTYFSGILFKYVEDDEVIMGRYFA